MVKVFGFNESAQEMEMYHSKADNALKELQEIGKDMMEEAKSNFAKVSNQRTGKGRDGIVMEKEGKKVTIGWSERPGLHGYFHELGFHALDNRGKRQHIRRTTKSRKRMYARVRATYVPPRPHMRPAFESHNADIEIRVQNKIT